MIRLVYKRKDRKENEIRKVIAKAGIIPKAVGSGYFKIGDTEAYAAVYGPRELYPKFLQNPLKGVLRCTYSMMPFSSIGERIKPGPNRRAKEISLVTTKALTPVLDLGDYPNTVVDVFIEITQADAGSRCAGICAASIALADAGIKMKELVGAVSVGKVGNTFLVDLTYNEENPENEEAVDIPLVMIPSTGEISLLQMDGRINKEDLLKCVEMAKPAIEKIVEAQKKALLQKYKEIGAAYKDNNVEGDSK